MAKVQMEAALSKGVSWGMAGDDQVLALGVETLFLLTDVPPQRQACSPPGSRSRAYFPLGFRSSARPDLPLPLHLTQCRALGAYAAFMRACPRACINAGLTDECVYQSGVCLTDLSASFDPKAQCCWGFLRNVSRTLPALHKQPAHPFSTPMKQHCSSRHLHA